MFYAFINYIAVLNHRLHNSVKLNYLA